MSRPKKRKVVVRFASRDPKNPKVLLDAVEQVFRPQDIEIEVGAEDVPLTSVGEETRALPDEQLETEVSRQAGALLDSKAETTVCDSENDAASKPDTIEANRQARSFIRRSISAGWRFGIKQVLDKVGEILWG